MEATMRQREDEQRVKECDVEVEVEEFDPVKYEQRAEQQLRQRIECDIQSQKLERERLEIDRRLAKKDDR